MARLCDETRTPLVPRGAGTGYTGGAVPVRGGVVLSLERLDRILEIDVRNLLAVVEPCVINGVLQDAVERVGLFYPPDPASLRESSIGGNVAECAGGPRAFKYGTTKRYVLGLEAVLPTGEVVRTGGKTVKNVVGYDLTQLLVGSEGTLAIITRIMLGWCRSHRARAALRATFARVADAVEAVDRHGRRRHRARGARARRRGEPGGAAPVSGWRAARPSGHRGAARGRGGRRRGRGGEEIAGVEAACRAARARPTCAWRRTRPSAKKSGGRAASCPTRCGPSPRSRYNHDVVVPKGRIPELFALAERLRRETGFLIPCFGHAGRRQHPRQHHGGWQRRRDQTARGGGRAGTVRGRRGARRLGDRRARDWVFQGAHSCRSRSRRRPSP